MARPVKKYKIGKIEANIWQNEFNGKKTFSFSFQKSYQDKEGNWKNTNNFYDNELAELALLVNKLANGRIRDIALNKAPEQVPEPPKQEEQEFEDDCPF